jgi:hypothetical protein
MKMIWACPCGSGYPLQVLARVIAYSLSNLFARCGLSASIPHATSITGMSMLEL